MAVIVGIFSFNGIEVIAVTSGEAKRSAARHSCRAAHHAAAAVPVLRARGGDHRDHDAVDRTGVKVVAQSPFVSVFQHSGNRARRRHHELRGDQRGALEHEHQHLPVLAHAVLAVARELRAAAASGGSVRRGTPVAAILISGACILAAAGGLDLHAQRLQLSARRGAVRRDPRVDVHPAEPPELPPPAPRGASCRCACRCFRGCSSRGC